MFMSKCWSFAASWAGIAVRRPAQKEEGGEGQHRAEASLKAAHF